MTGELHDVSAEVLAIPPDSPILTIPLEGVVEVEASGERQPDSPEAQVEAFLEATGVVFGAAEDAWRNVKICQQHFKGMVETFKAENSGGLSLTIRSAG